MVRSINFIAGVLLAMTIGTAQAQAVTELTDDNIRSFIEQTTAITSGRESEMDDEQINNYLDEHLHHDARFKSTMRYAIPGFDTQVKIMTVDKDDFIESIHQSANTMDGYESQIEVSEIKISKDGRKATLKTRTLESGKMPVSDNIELEEVPVEGMSTCTQTLMLSKEDIIQMYNATCVTDIQFKTFDP
ncbi:MAG: hypothetical protein KA155_02690 [Alphaproteobacteria bacterium]|jgi:hypothetical protein|nr:hypothetical protein [Alphaproteobacteria bacterium]